MFNLAKYEQPSAQESVKIVLLKQQAGGMTINM